MSTILERSTKTGRWIKGTRMSGVCFTITPDRLEEILRTGSLPKAFSNWKLKSNEFVERFVMDEVGITVFIGSR